LLRPCNLSKLSLTRLQYCRPSKRVSEYIFILDKEKLMNLKGSVDDGIDIDDDDEDDLI
jgi:hypothetical protein